MAYGGHPRSPTNEHSSRTHSRAHMAYKLSSPGEGRPHPSNPKRIAKKSRHDSRTHVHSCYCHMTFQIAYPIHTPIISTTHTARPPTSGGANLARLSIIPKKHPKKKHRHLETTTAWGRPNHQPTNQSTIKTAVFTMTPRIPNEESEASKQPLLQGLRAAK